MDSTSTIQQEFIGGERKETLQKEDYYMSLALLTASQSKDPSTQVGACIVDNDGNVISTGYNHPPRGWDDNMFPWGNNTKDNGEENTKYPYIVHAEMDACAKHDCEGTTCYVTLFPCTNCAKLLVSSGVKRVVYLHIYTNNPKELACAMEIFRNCGIEFISYSELKQKSYIELDMNVDPSTKENVKIRKKSNIKINTNNKE